MGIEPTNRAATKLCLNPLATLTFSYYKALSLALGEVIIKFYLYKRSII